MAKHEFDKDNQPKEEARKPRGKGKRVLMVDAIRAKYKTEESFLEAVLDMAMGSPMSDPPVAPNPQMMALVLQRVEPPHKPVYAPVDLGIAEGATAFEKSEAVTDAVLGGRLPSDIGTSIVGAIKSTVEIEESTILKEEMREVREFLGLDNV